jgi:hypothetical protein
MSLFRVRVSVYGVCRVKICKLEGVGAKAGSGLKFYCRAFLQSCWKLVAERALPAVYLCLFLCFLLN